ncbi:hypothetical protein E2C01_040219 [Portunus trituberculatus]|uniref:Uncharacterized protein n=1 Tax=Portunus trituberculatus TaxID=210409 RepID=A0A5B7FMQ9_PORTR|nr:hypothetical protein [Portunus trituberculatus]
MAREAESGTGRAPGTQQKGRQEMEKREQAQLTFFSVPTLVPRKATVWAAVAVPCTPVTNTRGSRSAARPTIGAGPDILRPTSQKERMLPMAPCWGHLPLRMVPEMYSMLRYCMDPLKHMWMFSLNFASMSWTEYTHTAEAVSGRAVWPSEGAKAATNTWPPSATPTLAAKSLPATTSLASCTRL